MDLPKLCGLQPQGQATVVAVEQAVAVAVEVAVVPQVRWWITVESQSDRISTNSIGMSLYRVQKSRRCPLLDLVVLRANGSL